MKKILSLDMSGQTGWAFQSADGLIASGVTPFLATLNPGSRWLRFDAWLGGWQEVKPELIVYEPPPVFVSVPERDPCDWSRCATGEAALAAPC